MNMSDLTPKYFNWRAQREGELHRVGVDGPTFAHATTKKMLHSEWAMPLNEAIETEAVAQAVCMTTRDFRRAYDAFVARQKPAFAGD